MKGMQNTRIKGFTLAETLIALMILGILATYTIPKLVSNQSASANAAKAKESLGYISEAFLQYKTANTVTAAFNAINLQSYLNYVSIDTLTSVDGEPNGSATYSCVSPNICLKMSNGSTVFFQTSGSLGGTTNNRCTWWLFDPDGRMTGKQDSIWFAIYYNGRVSSWGALDSCTDSAGTWTGGSHDPSWFRW